VEKVRHNLARMTLAALAALLETAASAGVREALDLLRSSPARGLFEPLEAALALSLGEPPLWPPEILGLAGEVGSRFGEKYGIPGLRNVG